jgi:hypothetical protein
MAGADMFRYLIVETNVRPQGANIAALLTILPRESTIVALKKAFLLASGLLMVVLYAGWFLRLRDMEPNRRSRLAEPLMAIFYLVLLIMSHKSLGQYRITPFLPAACWFATIGWTRIDTTRIWACMGYSLLAAVYQPFSDDWIMPCYFNVIWLPAAARPAHIATATAAAMYVLTAVLVAVEVAVFCRFNRDLNRMVRAGSS